MKKSEDSSIPLSEEFGFYDSCEPIEVESESAALTAIQSISSHISPQNSFEDRVNYLKKAVQYMKGSLMLYKSGNMKVLTEGISKALCDSRSKLVKAAAVLVATQARVLQTDFNSLLDPYFSALIKSICSTAIANRFTSHYCLLIIAQYCQTKLCASKFMELTNSKNDTLRLISAEVCFIIAETWQIQYHAIARDFVTRLMDDSVEDISRIAKRANTLFENPPAFKKGKITSLEMPEQIKPNKNPKRSQSASVSSNRPITGNIGSLIPPLNANSAKELIKLLSHSDNWPTISGKEDKLDMSLIYASQVVPASDFASLSPTFFVQYSQYIKPATFEILKNLNFDGQIMKIMHESLGLQEIAESFDDSMKKPETFNFFVSIVENKVPIEYTEKVQKTISSLISAFKKKSKSKVLQNALDQLRPVAAITDLLDKVNQRLSNGEIFPPKEFISQWPTAQDAQTAAEKKMWTFLPNLILKEAAFLPVVTFITGIATSVKPVSFSFAVSPILKRIQSDPAFHVLGIECLSTIICEVQSMASLLAEIKNNKTDNAFVESCLEAMLVYFSSAPAQRLLHLEKTVTHKLLPFLESDEIQIRKNVIMLFAQMMKKIPKKFEKRLKRLTVAQQKMVFLIAQRE